MRIDSYENLERFDRHHERYDSVNTDANEHTNLWQETAKVAEVFREDLKKHKFEINNYREENIRLNQEMEKLRKQILELKEKSSLAQQNPAPQTNSKVNQTEVQTVESKEPIPWKAAEKLRAGMKGTKIRLLKDIPNFLFSNIDQDLFKTEMDKKYPNAKVTFEDNQIMIEGKSIEADNIGKEFDDYSSHILTQTLTSARIEFTKIGAYTLTHEDKKKMQEIEAWTEAEIKGLSCTPWKTVATARVNDLTQVNHCPIRLVIGDYSTCDAALKICIHDLDTYEKGSFGDTARVMMKLPPEIQKEVKNNIKDGKTFFFTDPGINLGKKILHCVISSKEFDMKYLVKGIFDIIFDQTKSKTPLENGQTIYPGINSSVINFSTIVFPAIGGLSNQKHLNSLTLHVKEVLEAVPSHGIKEIQFISQHQETCKLWSKEIETVMSGKPRIVDYRNETGPWVQQYIENPSDDIWLCIRENGQLTPLNKDHQNQIQYLKQIKAPLKFSLDQNEFRLEFDSTNTDRFVCWSKDKVEANKHLIVEKWPEYDKAHPPYNPKTFLGEVSGKKARPLHETEKMQRTKEIKALLQKQTRLTDMEQEKLKVAYNRIFEEISKLKDLEKKPFTNLYNKLHVKLNELSDQNKRLFTVQYKKSLAKIIELTLLDQDNFIALYKKSLEETGLKDEIKAILEKKMNLEKKATEEQKKLLLTDEERKKLIEIQKLSAIDQLELLHMQKQCEWTCINTNNLSKDELQKLADKFDLELIPFTEVINNKSVISYRFKGYQYGIGLLKNQLV